MAAGGAGGTGGTGGTGFAGGMGGASGATTTYDNSAGGGGGGAGGASSVGSNGSNGDTDNMAGAGGAGGGTAPNMGGNGAVGGVDGAETGGTPGSPGGGAGGGSESTYGVRARHRGCWCRVGGRVADPDHGPRSGAWLEPHLMHACDIDASFVAQPAAGLLFVAVGDELVLLDGWDAATRLSATGAMIWSSLDGKTKLADVAAHLAAATAVDEDVVMADVLRFVCELGKRGLLTRRSGTVRPARHPPRGPAAARSRGRHRRLGTQ